MYLLARVIKSMGIKMVLSGEGADEVFGGYLYFPQGAHLQAFHEETVRKPPNCICTTASSQQSLASLGSGRTSPSSTKNSWMLPCASIRQSRCARQGDRKKVVREAFADMLPRALPGGRKNRFSDGVGYSWIDTLKAVTAAAVSDEQMAHAAERFLIHTPQNKEEYCPIAPSLKSISQ